MSSYTSINIYVTLDEGYHLDFFAFLWESTSSSFDTGKIELGDLAFDLGMFKNQISSNTLIGELMNIFCFYS